MSEILDIVDLNGQPTGQTIERTIAHAQGIWHRTAHVWLLRYKKDTLQILLQKRSDDKDSFPGCYDISSAGHIPAGVDFIPSALRELEEELGVIVQPEQLKLCGDRKIITDQFFHGQNFLDRQYTRVFCLWLDQEAEAFVLQPEEIDAVKWFDFQACYNLVANNEIPHCIELEELDLVYDHK